MGMAVRWQDTPGAKAYLSDASLSVRWFDPPATSVDEMVDATADWVSAGGATLGKPTHFEVSDGVY